MKVLCTGNELAKLYLSAYHRSYFERFLSKTKPRWEAEIGASYTVYAITILRGVPFYCVSAPANPWGDRWVRIPSVCFEITDPRPSSHWLFNSRVKRAGDNEVFVTELAIAEWINDPMFLQHLVENRAREVAIMSEAAARMDAEFA